jgi:hypothetical protein
VRGKRGQLTVSSSVGVLNGVHLHTADLGPGVALHLQHEPLSEEECSALKQSAVKYLVLVVAVSGLQHGLVNTTTTSDDSDRRAVMLNSERTKIGPNTMHVGASTYNTWGEARTDRAHTVSLLSWKSLLPATILHRDLVATGQLDACDALIGVVSLQDS